MFGIIWQEVHPGLDDELKLKNLAFYKMYYTFEALKTLKIIMAPYIGPYKQFHYKCKKPKVKMEFYGGS